MVRLWAVLILVAACGHEALGQTPVPDRAPKTPVPRKSPEGVKEGQPWLGVSRWLANEREVVLLGALADGPAGKAGLIAGDVIRSIQGRPIASLVGFEAELNKLGPTDAASIEIDRRGQRRQVDVKLEPIPKDRGVGRVVEAAKSGHGWAMCELGMRYALMDPSSAGVATDPAEGVRWFQRAMDAGYPLAPFFLGIMTLEGRGTNVDVDEARRLLILARETRGDGVPRGLAAAASCQLAIMCLRGQGIEQDTTSALRFFRDAAEQGSPAAMHRIGVMFELGLGVAQDDGEAVRWYRRAAELGYQPAQQSMIELAVVRSRETPSTTDAPTSPDTKP
ncbi:MAG: PDZ domain-containing protein [Planctomycetes bacterium]|nr:PDZ domain-containing protein [Planctomycetota bacterium]